MCTVDFNEMSKCKILSIPQVQKKKINNHISSFYSDCSSTQHTEDVLLSSKSYKYVQVSTWLYRCNNSKYRNKDLIIMQTHRENVSLQATLTEKLTGNVCETWKYKIWGEKNTKKTFKTAVELFEQKQILVDVDSEEREKVQPGTQQTCII